VGRYHVVGLLSRWLGRAEYHGSQLRSGGEPGAHGWTHLGLLLSGDDHHHSNSDYHHATSDDDHHAPRHNHRAAEYRTTNIDHLDNDARDLYWRDLIRCARSHVDDAQTPADGVEPGPGTGQPAHTRYFGHNHHARMPTVSRP